MTLIPANPERKVANARMENKIQLPEHELESEGLLLIPIASESKRKFKGNRNKASKQLSIPNNFIMKSNLHV
jgi:hypothetical protein